MPKAKGSSASLQVSNAIDLGDPAPALKQGHSARLGKSRDAPDLFLCGMRSPARRKRAEPPRPAVLGSDSRRQVSISTSPDLFFSTGRLLGNSIQDTVSSGLHEAIEQIASG
mmetsp:Transcript_18297/g.55208  ORF Transcript_18297/g.55208 Transcript_18297/m.55208 type:complete len:112 (+) Transcript_18297:177-512(+)